MQTGQQQFAAGLHQRQSGSTGVVFGLQQIQGGAIAYLAAELGGVLAGGAGLLGGGQCSQAGWAGLQRQPGALDLLRGLLARVFEFGLGLVLQAQRFLLACVAHATSKHRHRPLHAHHALAAGVAGAAKVAVAADAVLADLRYQVERGAGGRAVLGRFFLRTLHAQGLQAQGQIALQRLGLPLL